MNVKSIIRVALCAAIVALPVAGVGLFPAQSVAGKEIKPSTLQGAAAIEQLKQDGQYDALQTAMKQARFSVSRAENTPLGRYAWHAPNPMAGYDAYITEAGVSIALNDESYVSLSLQSIGYGKALRAVAPGEVSGDKQTISLTRDGGVREWYVNGPDGLEQGFTLAQPPGFQQAGVPLRLALQVSEGWRAVLREDGQQVTLLSADGKAVDYGKLVVRDSQGSYVPARLRVAGQQVIIEVEESAAAYPLTIDPTFSLQQKVLAPDGGAGDAFGQTAALSGDTLVVGAFSDNIGSNSDQGSAYVFTRSGTVWNFQQKLTADDGAAYDQFGADVEINGNTLVVGANFDTIGANANQGSVYVFTRSGTVWTFQQKLFANDGAADEFFGSAVAINGDTLVVGVANADFAGHAWQGSVYVFTRSGAYWSQLQKLTASDGAATDYFGVDVALDGNTLAVGAYRDFVTYVDQGSVYIFTRNGAYWTEQQKVIAGDAEEADLFGRSVALSGNTLVVGTPDDNIGANGYQGSAYVFTRNGAVWTLQRKLTANDGAPNEAFGVSVAISGDTVVVGAPYANIGANLNQGSAYVFTRNGAIWSQQQKLTANDGANDDIFGYAVSISGDTMVVGALGDDIGAISDQGSVYVFVRPACPTITIAPATLPSGFSGIPYQQSITASGGAGPYQFALNGGTLPIGISLTSNGLLSGTTTRTGTYQFWITATDLSSGCSASRNYTLIVWSCLSVTIDPPVLPYGIKGSPYIEQFFATGGIEPYTFSKQSGLLPPGLSLSADGVVSGTPTRAGNFSFTLLIADQTGCTSAWPTSISIRLREF